MSQNPYESPSDLVTPHAPRKSSKWLACVAVAGWLIFFLLPAFGVFAGRAFPGPYFDAPNGDTMLSRLSLILGTPMEPLLFVSLIGCVVLVACLPIKLRWKATAIVGWFPLTVVQIIAIYFTLALLGYPPYT